MATPPRAPWARVSPGGLRCRFLPRGKGTGLHAAPERQYIIHQFVTASMRLFAAPHPTPYPAGMYLPQDAMQPGGVLREWQAAPPGRGTWRRRERRRASSRPCLLLCHPSFFLPPERFDGFLPCFPDGPTQASRPGLPLAEGMWTHSTYWRGDFADGMIPALKQYGNLDLLDNIRWGGIYFISFYFTFFWKGRGCA